MISSAVAPAEERDLAGRLKAATARAHMELEAALDLLAPPLTVARFASILERFYGFHLVWEPAMAQVPGFEVLMGQRSRLDALTSDLKALGRSEAQLDNIARCGAARSLARSAPAAFGSLYVMEGSTLGGQVISRALAQASWLPAEGLSYFNPYGPRTGVMWRTFKATAPLLCRPGEEPEAEAGAIATFDLLRLCLTQGGGE